MSPWKIPIHHLQRRPRAIIFLTTPDPAPAWRIHRNSRADPPYVSSDRQIHTHTAVDETAGQNFLGLSPLIKFDVILPHHNKDLHNGVLVCVACCHA